MQNGDWERIFSSWERNVVIYVGAAVMYLVGKRLKKRHQLLDDTRQSLYNEVNYFLKMLQTKGTRFIGGEEPNLADLAVYACISSIDGRSDSIYCCISCPIFKEFFFYRNNYFL